MSKIVKRLPIEYFCAELENLSETDRSYIDQQYCRYLRATCNKPRKSQPLIKVGICSLGSTVASGDVVYPVIICPQRLKEAIMFKTIEEKYLSSWNNVHWVQEVDMGVGGNVDYVAFELDDNGNVKNFQCVELQAAGTTGTPYPYALALAKGESTDNLKDTSGKKITFGINWANEFTKTMMQQAYKKGKIVEQWGRKIIFVVQDIAIAYLQRTSDCSLLGEPSPNSPVDFCTFKMDWTETEGWHLKFDRILSTSIEGINRIISGAEAKKYPTPSDFMDIVKRKSIADSVIDSK
ncbi:MAG: hypothetical protein ACI3Y4_01305 [Candidatus Cryptobacteroides sp.]